MRLPRLYSPQRKRGSTERDNLFKLYRASSPDVDMRFHYSQSLIVLLCVTAMQAQTITRVWPAEAQSSLRGIVVTDNGRLYTAGDNSTLLESSDNGRSWKELSLGDHVLHIYKLCTDGTMLFLLAHPPRNAARPDPWPEG